MTSSDVEAAVEIVSPAPGAGVPDEIERLWTPQRMAYIRGEGKPADGEAGEQCPFCRVPQLPDEDGYMLARGTHVFAVLNLYPYSPGHVLVCPYEHVPSYLDIEGETLAEFTDFTRRAIRALRTASSPHGFNLGMNQGAVAGAGIAAHLHQHVVPRWGGDANFMPIIARTKPLPELLGDTWRRVRDAWPVEDR